MRRCGSFWCVALLVVVPGPGCMVMPQNGDYAETSSEPVVMVGSVPAANAEVWLQSATSPSGPFVDIGVTTSATTPISMFDGIAYYLWTGSALVPSWSTTACGNEEAYLRARLGSNTLYFFDAAHLRYQAATQPGIDGETCFFNLANNGQDHLAAMLACASDASAVRVLAGPATYVGNVVISTQAQADNFECYTEINGNLTISDSSELLISLPHLRTVTGDVTIVLSSQPGPQPYSPEVRKVHLDKLEVIGGQLSYSYPGGSGDIAVLELGLPQLTSLGADLSVQATTFNLTLNGLEQLPSINGDLTLQSSGHDLSCSMLDQLTSVGGNVMLASSNTTYGCLTALQSVGGSVTVNGSNLVVGNLMALASVGGDLTLTGGGSIPPNSLTSLASVGGTLTLQQIGFLTALSLGSNTGLSVGALDLDANPALSSLAATPVTVIGSGGIAIHGHPLLTQCEAQAFVTAQQALGWTGTATVANNAPCR